MTADLAPALLPTQSLPAELHDVAAYVDASLAHSTRRAYRTGLADFRRWCEAQDLEVLPAGPETVARYLAELAKVGRKVATIEQRAAAIRWAHETAGLESPTAAKGVRATLRGIRRELGTAPTRKVPATVERIGAMVAHTDRSTLKGKRDAALLLFGFHTRGAAPLGSGNRSTGHRWIAARR